MWGQPPRLSGRVKLDSLSCAAGPVMRDSEADLMQNNQAQPKLASYPANLPQ
jgi:hypothetical protein